MKRISIVLLLTASITSSLGAMEPAAKRARVSPDERRFEAAKQQIAGISRSFAAKKYRDAQMVVFDKMYNMVCSKLDACIDEEALMRFNRELPLVFADVTNAIPAQDMAICTGVLGTEFMKSFVEQALQMQQECSGALITELSTLPGEVSLQEAKGILSRQFKTFIDRMKQLVKDLLIVTAGDDAAAAE